MANLTTLASGSSVVLTVTEQQSIVLNNGRTDVARLQITTGPGAGSVVTASHNGRRVYGPFGAGTITLSAVSGDVRYELSGDSTSPLDDDGQPLTATENQTVRALVSGAWSQYDAQSKTDADALASVLYTRTFQPGELIAGDALIAEGLLTVPNSAATKRCRLEIGGVVYMAIDLTTSSTFHWRIKMRMRSLSSQIGWATGSSNGAFGSTSANVNVTSAIDFSAPVVVQFTAQWPVAGAGANSIVLEAIDLERFRPAA